eukprot:69078-Pyramimonas_sp.AAC.2
MPFPLTPLAADGASSADHTIPTIHRRALEPPRPIRNEEPPPAPPEPIGGAGVAPPQPIRSPAPEAEGAIGDGRTCCVCLDAPIEVRS